ncbi:MAG: histidine phosphatase family protein [Chloroflexota bacterium]|nr:histidine phosphatase family protein [Chloroflexota bacterium]
MELYIIRHGQSSNNVLQNQVTRTHDPALTPLGVQQADALAEYLSGAPSRDPLFDHTTGYSETLNERGIDFTHLYCSPMYRALQTAQPIARALGMQPEVWVAIHEHGGIYLETETGVIGYPGRNRTDILADFPNYMLLTDVTDSGWWNPARGHESMADAYGRAITVAQELRRRAGDDPDARIGLVTHGTFIDALLKALFNQLPNRSMFYLHYNTAMTRLDFRSDGRVLIRFVNRVDHLLPEWVS